MIGRLNTGVGHVHVTVLKNDGALRIEEMLDSNARLRAELETATQLWSARCECRVLHAAAQVEKRNSSMVRLAIKPEQERVTQQVAARMNSVSEDSFIHNLKASNGKARRLEIAHDKSQLRLSN
jgi:hypothetical protein